VGNGGVGKSTMTARYCKGVYTTTYKKTIGVDFLEKTIELDAGESVKLMIWDTAGQEEFDALTASYYRGAGACALVFSTVDRASFDAVEKWRRKIEAECGTGVVMCLVQNKVRGGARAREGGRAGGAPGGGPARVVMPPTFVFPPPARCARSRSAPPSFRPQVDLLDEAAVTPDEVEALARRLKMRLFRTCVKENVAVTAVFEHLAAQYILTAGGGGGAEKAMPAVGEMREGTLGGTRSPGGAGAAAAAAAAAGAGGAGGGGALSPAAGARAGVAPPRTPLGSPPPTPAARERVYDPDAEGGGAAAGAARARAGGSIKLGAREPRQGGKAKCC